MTTYTTALVSSNLFGDSSKGKLFNDLQDVVGSMNITIDTSQPIKQIKLMHCEAIDGIEIKYYKSNHDAGTTTVHHGTSSDCDDVDLYKTTISIGDTESIVAISGKAGDATWGGVRVVQLNFAIYDSSTGNMRIAGPYGGNTGKAFRVTSNGNFIALSGFAIDTDLSLRQLKAAQQDGGLYGLVFDEVDYRSV
ncbi:hypothetical protein C8F01DRAFT_1253353 [Mycena amicta]|nr:hypothetical protein C8F01DRAFT_1253353 [Mycena amicta]